jgi:hypothetical protein
MAFRVLFLSHAPDANSEEHRTVIDTGMYRLSTVVMRERAEAVETCEALLVEEGLDAVLLCPGFTHRDVAEIVEATKGEVAVCVARGDGPSSAISSAAMRREGYPSRSGGD